MARPVLTRIGYRVFVAGRTDKRNSSIVSTAPQPAEQGDSRNGGPTPHAPRANKTLSRRRLLQAGAVSALGLSLPQLLQQQSRASGLGAPAAKSCIFIYQYGGLSQLDSWDPKPLAPSEIRGPYRPIATATPGFQVGELMPKLARLSERYAVIRSMTHREAIHDRANKMLLAGLTAPTTAAPSFGSIVSRLSPTSANVPPYVWLQKFGGGAAPPDDSYLTGGSLGAGYAPMLIGERHDEHFANPDFRVTAFDPVAGIDHQRVRQRWDLYQSLQASRPASLAAGGDELATFQNKAFELLHGTQARDAFRIELEQESTRDLYGRHPLGQNLLMARRLVEAGVRLVSCVAWTGLAAGEEFLSVETWDMHGNAGIGIFDDGWNGLGFALPRCDQAVAALLTDLEQRGLLETTLVVLVGEFGRTPTISRGAKAIGRDHWPNCYSAMLAGAGIQGGAVYGESDAQAAYVHGGAVSLEDFTATLLTAMGIDSRSRLAPDGFTQPASPGEPITALL